MSAPIGTDGSGWWKLRTGDASASIGDLARLRQAILNLPTPERDVFVLSRFERQSYEQIAKTRGVTKEEARDLLANALLLLVSATSDRAERVLPSALHRP